MESEILRALDFDFIILSPLTFLERFLRLADLHEDYKIVTLSEELCKLSMTKVSFLDYKPSIIAGCALILACNLADSSTSNPKE
jgi:hypothetical protein